MDRHVSPARVRSNGRRAPRRGVRGFTIVELMVSLTLALLILAGLVTLFSNTSVARGEIDKTSRQIENGRFAMQTLSDEIRHAGYFGALANAPTVPADLPQPCSTAVVSGTSPEVGIGKGIGLPIQGYAGDTAANMTAALPCLNAAAGYVPNTAVLVVRRVSTAPPMTPAAVASAVAGSFYLQTSGCAGDAKPYVLDTGSGTFDLHAKNGGTPCLPLATAPAGPISPLFVRIYFVSKCSNTDCTAAGADSAPTLKRIDITPGFATVTPIVDGIENIQFEYGLDSDGDGAPDGYTRTTTAPPPAPSPSTPLFPATPAEWSNAVSVRVHLLARNIEPTGGFTDSKTYALGADTQASSPDAFKRHVYNEVVRINNVAGRRE